MSIMTKILCFFHYKGGVGKSVTSAATGANLASRGFKVLLMDLDSQANLTKNMLGPSDQKETVLTTFQKGKFPIQKIHENLYIVPSGKSVAALSATLDRNQMDLLKKALEKVKGQFDFVILDCPPAIGMITINAIRSSDYLFVPVLADQSSFDDLDDTSIVAIKATGGKMNMSGIFFTQFESNLNISKEMVEQVKERYGDLLMTTRIRKCSKVKEALTARKDLFSYAPNCTAAQDYVSLVDEILDITKANKQ